MSFRRTRTSKFFGTWIAWPRAWCWSSRLPDVRLRLAALACVVLLSQASASFAGPGTQALGGVNGVRARLSLPPLGHNVIADRLVAEIAATDTADRSPQVLDSQPECAVCRVVFDRSGASASPQRL